MHTMDYHLAVKRRNPSPASEPYSIRRAGARSSFRQAGRRRALLRKVEAFFEKLSAVKGRAVASVAAIALCCSVAVGGVMAFTPEDPADNGVAMANMRVSEPVVEQYDGEAHADLLSTLE